MEVLEFWQVDPTKSARVGLDMLEHGAQEAQRSAAEFKGAWRTEDQELADITRREADEGGLVGPFTAKELTEMLGPNWVPSRRFWIRQGSKLRPIDDFSEFGVNQAFGSGRKASMKSLDHVVALARAWTEAVDAAFDDGSRRSSFKDSEGVVHQGMLHPLWMREA